MNLLSVVILGLTQNRALAILSDEKHLKSGSQSTKLYNLANVCFIYDVLLIKRPFSKRFKSTLMRKAGVFKSSVLALDGLV